MMTIFKRIAVTSAAVAAITVVSPSAVAKGGQSATTSGCFSTWGNTGASSHCYKVPRSQTVATRLACSNEPDYTSAYTSMGKGATIPNFGQVDCWYSATSARPTFK